MQRQYPGDTLAYMTQAYSDIGLLDANVDLKAAALSLYEGEVVGFFDPASHAMAVMQTAPPAAQEQVLRHELVHAQQDAYVALEPLIAAATVDDDRALALQAVLEGQAVVASSAAALSALSAPRATAVDDSIGFALKDAGIDISDDELQGLLGAQADLSALSESAANLLADADVVPSPGSALNPASHQPPYLRAQLLFPYQQGAQFIASLQKGSTLPKVVAATLKRLPQTTREILHPELYQAGYMPERLPLKKTTSVPGYEVMFSTTVGELNMRTLLAGGAAEQASLLRSDQLLLLRGPDSLLVTAWLSQWESEKAAVSFATALKAGWRASRRILGGDRFGRKTRVDCLWQKGSGVAVMSQPLNESVPAAQALRDDLAARNPG